MWRNLEEQPTDKLNTCVLTTNKLIIFFFRELYPVRTAAPEANHSPAIFKNGGGNFFDSKHLLGQASRPMEATVYPTQN